ncbi:hypothetical protein P280DRAFT_112089 [Massarina eburnea CBS 473.64]|uniref:Uncharacterized protein n=1 Tax=Massarina eburnea CBS 473.64 TaxID=1395130 RepID=A0A6A6RRG3_9PLEO|nr:hypothetical protein P280DRAFT_112089 [Massarina eburnea CBS 473.64]
MTMARSTKNAGREDAVTVQSAFLGCVRVGRRMVNSGGRCVLVASEPIRYTSTGTYPVGVAAPWSPTVYTFPPNIYHLACSIHLQVGPLYPDDARGSDRLSASSLSRVVFGFTGA